MIKVYGMIILVMAMDIDGCALAKSGWGEGNALQTRFFDPKMFQVPTNVFLFMKLLELLSNLHVIVLWGSSFNLNLFLGFSPPSRCFEQGGEPGEIQAVNRVERGKQWLVVMMTSGIKYYPSYIGIISESHSKDSF